MIAAVSNEPFEALLLGAPTGLGAALSVGVYDPSDATQILPASSAGITEPQPGTYRAALTVTVVGSFMVRWAWGAVSAEEELTVTVSPPVPTSSYATLDDVNDYLGMVLTSEEGTRHLARAMDDVDAAVGPRPLTVDGHKFDPTRLTTGQAVALRKATCVQVEYRLQVGESFMIEDQYESRAGRNYSSVGKLRKIAPAAMSYLYAGNLLNLTIGGGRHDPNWLPNQNNA